MSSHSPDTFFVDIASKSMNCRDERICGDTFRHSRCADGNRYIAVMSDGMGHGVKANILSTFTATMLLNFIKSHEDLTKMSEMILQMLPVCSVRKVSYSTFAIADIDTSTGEVTIANHDSPQIILLRNGAPHNLIWDKTSIERKEGRPLVLQTTSFKAMKNDRIIIVSDGVTQSGQREGLYKFGWGEQALEQFVTFLTSVNSGISSSDMSSQVISKSYLNDSGHPSDDMTCVSIHFREPKKLMLISCPPSIAEYNKELLELSSSYSGQKVICGHPVAHIIAEQMNITLQRSGDPQDPLAAPYFNIPGFDMVSEGIIVPNHTLEILENYPSVKTKDHNLAERLSRMLLRSDVIDMVIGMRRDISSSNYDQDVFELRRNTLRRISSLLETKFGKKVNFTYL